MLAARWAGGGSLTVPLVHHLAPGMSSIFKSPSILPLQSLFPKKAELVTQHRAQSMDRRLRNEWARARVCACTHTHSQPRHTDRGHPFSQFVDTITPLWWSLGCERWGLLDGPQDAGLYHLWSLMLPRRFLWEGVVNLSVLADFQSL